MNYSKDWDAIYKSGHQLSRWPWSDLVSYVMRFSKPNKSPVKVLELGCGAGANIPFFNTLKVDYYAIESSPTVVKLLKQKYPELNERIIVGDFTLEIPFFEHFDLIIDRASLTHNTTNAILNCISLIKSKLVANGIFIGVDWFSKEHSEFTNGEFIEDNYTKTNFLSGQFLGVGKTHFSDKVHLIDLFGEFEIIKLDHKKIFSEIPKDNHIFASYNLVVKN
jgi:SAM-dependent methyltransferase